MMMRKKGFGLDACLDPRRPTRKPQANRSTLLLKAAAVLSPVVLICTAASAFGAATVRLMGHVAQAQIARSQDLGRIDAGQTIKITVALKLKNPADLEALIKHQQTPGDPLYGVYLTPSEFKARFAPSDDDVAKVTASLGANGLKLGQVHANNLFINFEAPSRTVESALGLTIHKFRTQDNRQVYAAVSEPSVSAEIAPSISGIVGLNNFAHPQKHIRPSTQTGPRPDFTGSSPNGSLLAADIQKAYSVPSSVYNGTGQTVALIEYDGYNLSDIKSYATLNNLTAPNIQNVLVDNATGAATTGANSAVDEVTLDIDMVLAVAPSSKILVYEGTQLADTTGQEWLDVFDRVATDNLASVVSVSYGITENNDDSASFDDVTLIPAENTILQQMASQGQSVFIASGDSGAYNDGNIGGTLTVGDPGSQPYVTSVGGTSLTLASNGSYTQEAVWGYPASGGRGAQGGGGGVSVVWKIPSWQSQVAATLTQGSTTMRNTPDVSLNADPYSGYYVILNQQGSTFGGTSAAAPLWAAFTALVNQARASANLARVGFLNPALYLIGGSSLFSSCFHDVSSGNNLYYLGKPGYDLGSGWGTFNAGALLNALTSPILPPAAPTAVSVKVLSPSVKASVRKANQRG